jgi:hypothetical protein
MKRAAIELTFDAFLSKQLKTPATILRVLYAASLATSHSQESASRIYMRPDVECHIRKNVDLIYCKVCKCFISPIAILNNPWGSINVL